MESSFPLPAGINFSVVDDLLVVAVNTGVPEFLLDSAEHSVEHFVEHFAEHFAEHSVEHFVEHSAEHGVMVGLLELEPAKADRQKVPPGRLVD